ncbi:hypothetical protein QAD02_010927 [Eretmocerus hayati]|uniref:Uncharacterized protein n=1 Tax=Eretmocerus hayati TaxID=131215 RepID=A0ACC2NVG7_9HYME|nr:hypothetical protein QAD02_010927 [Eretmocerus hayati]
MDSKKLFKIILTISVAACILADGYDPSLKYIVDYMKSNLATYQVTLMSTSTEKFESFGSKIVKLVTDEFSSIVINRSGFEKIPKVKSIRNLWDRIIDQSKLKIGIVEIHDEQDVLIELEPMILYMMWHSPFFRGKCIILLINGRGQSLEPFLRLAWSNDFLDLTVVEWVNKTQTRTLTATETLSSEVFIHIFNPFQDKYTKDRLSNTTDILPCKARNLHGYNFHADPRGAPGFGNRKRSDDSEVKPIKYLMDTLNFTMTYAVVNDSNHGKSPIVALFNRNTSRGRRIDFRLNSYLSRPSANFSDVTTDMNFFKDFLAMFVYKSSFREYRFSLLQGKITEFRISSNFLTTFVILFAMCLIFLLSSRIMGFDKRIWSLVNIARVMMGGSLEIRRRTRLGEKILLITLYFVSIIMITLTSDELLKMSVSKRDVLQCTTLEELADSRVTLHIEKKTSEFLSWIGGNDPKFQKIANKSTIVSHDDVINAYDHPTSVNLKYLALSEVPVQFPRVVKMRSNLYMVYLREVIMPRMEYMPTRLDFPLKRRFAEFFLKLSESGLIVHHQMLENFKLLNNMNEWGMLWEMYPQYGPDMDQEEEVSLTQRLLMILVSGYVLASIVLIWEIFFKSPCSAEITESKSKRELFVRCLVEEARSNIEEESSHEFDLTQSLNDQLQLRISTLGRWGFNKNTSRLSVNSNRRRKNEGCDTTATKDRLRVVRLLELDNAHLIAHLERKKRARIQMGTYDEQSPNHR